MRVIDEAWAKILRCLKVGECRTEDLNEVQKLVLINPGCNIPDFSTGPGAMRFLLPRGMQRKICGTLIYTEA